MTFSLPALAHGERRNCETGFWQRRVVNTREEDGNDQKPWARVTGFPLVVAALAQNCGGSGAQGRAKAEHDQTRMG